MATGVLLSLAAAGALACPPSLSPAELRNLAGTGEGRLGDYAQQRWMKCGWPAASPAMLAWRRQSAADPAGRDDGPGEFAQALFELAVLNPQAVVDDYHARFVDEPDPEDPPAYADLLRLAPRDEEVIAHFEQGLAPLVALLDRERGLGPAERLSLQLALVAAQIRAGNIDAARRHFAQLQKRAGAGDEANVELASLGRVLAPAVQLSPSPSGPGWVLDRSFVECGTPALEQRRHGRAHLREQVLRADGSDAALAELIDSDWRSDIGGSSEYGLRNAALLRERVGDAALRAGWIEALATLRADDEVVGLHLLGQFLPLPSAVVENEPDAPGSRRERRLTPEELAQLVRGTALYRASHAPAAGQH